MSLSLAPGDDVIDLERDTDAQQHWESDDVGEIQLEARCSADFEGNDRCKDEREKRHRHVREPTQKKPEQNRNGNKRINRRLNKSVYDGLRALGDSDRWSGGVWMTLRTASAKRLTTVSSL